MVSFLRSRMLSLAKRFAQIVSNRSVLIITFWVVSNLLLLSACALFSLNKKTYTYGAGKNQTLSEDKGEDVMFPEEIKMALSFLLVPSLVIILFSRSILIVFSTSMACLNSMCLLIISNHFFPLTMNLGEQLKILLFVTVANTVAARKCWERYRRGPSESTIGRLLLLSIDKSLPMVLTMTLTGSLIPTMTLISMDVEKIVMAIIFFLVNVSQNLCSLSILFSMLLIRHNSNFTLPSTTIWLIRTWEALIDGKLIYIAHFMVKAGNYLLFSAVRIPYVAFYIILIVAYFAGMIFRVVVNLLSDEVTGNMFDSALECASTACWKEFLFAFALLLLPTFFHLLISRHKINGLVGILVVAFSLGAYFLTVDIFHLPYQAKDFNVILATVVPTDVSLRLCLAYRCSQKKRNSSRVIDAMDQTFSQVTIAFITCFFTSVSNRLIQNTMTDELPFLIILISSWTSFLFFMPAAFVLLGVMSSCGRARRESSQSESRSIFTDKQSAQFLFDHPDYTRRYSSANYYGNGKHRKSVVAVTVDDTRRASMPVAVRHKILSSCERWKSIDYGMGSVTKREALLRSQAESMISDVMILEEQ